MRQNVILWLGLALLLASCEPNSSAADKTDSTSTSPSTNTPTNSEAPITELEGISIRTILVKTGMLEARRNASATLAAATDSVVVAEQSGRVVSLQRRAGDQVNKGQIVLTLENSTLENGLADARLALESARVNASTLEKQNPEDLTQARSRLIAAQSALENATRLKRANQRIYAVGGVSEVELRNSRAAEQQARVELEGAQSVLSRAGRAGSEGLAAQKLVVQQAQNRLNQLERDLAQTRVVAPFSGRIVEVYAQTGEFISSGNRAFRLIDPSSLKVRFSVPSSEASKLTVGKSVLLKVADQTVNARISRNSGVPGENRLVALEARVVGALKGVRPGTSGRLEYRLTLAKGVRVPTAALRFDGDKRTVLTVENGRSVAREVTVLGDAGGEVAVKGIPAGSRVIYPVPGGLLPDRPVTVVEP